MHRYLALISIIGIACLCTGIESHAQSSAFVSPNNLAFHIVDSASGQSLAGVRITIKMGTDSVQLLSDSQGKARFPIVNVKQDSLEIATHHLTYATRTLWVRTPRFNRTEQIRIQLVPKTEELAEIVVVGEALAVVRRGDTIQYNAEAFKTFVNDPMERLFQVLPGMRLEDGVLTYLGQPIKRITIDGERLFGNDVSLALENIRADDVVNVRVFKEASDEAKLDGIKNPELETVADVQTKSKPQYIRRGTADANLGTTGNSKYAADQLLYDGKSSMVKTRVGNTLSAELSGKNIGPYYKTSQQNGSFAFSREVINKFRFATRNNLSKLHKTTSSKEIRDYLPTAEFESLRQQDSSVSLHHSGNWVSSSEISRTFTNKDIVGITLFLRPNFSSTKNSSRSETYQDGHFFQSQGLNQRDRIVSPLNNILSTGYSKKLSSTRLNFELNGGLSPSTSTGKRNDSIGSRLSSTNVVLSKNGTGRDFRYGGMMGFSWIASPNLNISFTERLNRIHQNTQANALDELTGHVDTTNSYQFLINEFNSQMTSGMTYRNNAASPGISAAYISLQWESRTMQRDDRFPREKAFSKPFHALGLSSELVYRLKSFNEIKVNYKRTPGYVSILNFIPLDNADPLLLRAGNYNLNIPMENMLELKTNFIHSGNALELTSKYTYEENTHVERSRYFRNPTFLPEYNYTTVAGARLITQESVSGTQSWMIRANYSAYMGKFIIHLQPIYQYRQVKGYIQDELLNSHLSRYFWKMTWIGNFSSTLSPSLSSTSAYTTRRNEYEQSRAFSQELSLEIKAMLASKLEIRNTNTLDWTWVNPERQKIDRFGAVSNLSLAYLFDKRGLFKFKAEFKDLLDLKRRAWSTVYEEYTSTNYSYALGRHFTTGVYWEF